MKEITTGGGKVFPTTAAQFKRAAEAAFRRANPDADTVGLVINWTHGPKRVTFPTGLKGYSGVGTAAAPGFRPKTIVASGTPDTGISVR
jgi:hypothetical protein